ncbi:enoyl-CoA hydratase/isomerase family protein [Calidifontibacillus erzurumensis]|uniref:Enoyl-CoA hydratase/isomerase family protein n=1 Tax=Calidifontibacillus erzurumensis TaxID=2741433 RepID=A0A8J8GBL4_9BACI|nr:enoyl-CoA hydratase-related protein [Calidifontibacillus erzurumensis]NSL50549.1 enoyl-CoA hydratase/isomerase family protein [Calidifontibacillus erzurumensis]
MNKYQYIKVESRDSIGFLVLNRPKVLNALNRKMVREIVEALEAFDHDDSIKVIVLSGEGRAFAAGADIDEMAEDDSIRLELLNQFADWDRIALIKKPIIGAVHGFALGGGFELALCCDVLFAAENAQFGFPEINIGVMPGAGGTQRLTKLMGKTKALEWLWLGEPMSAKEALHYGVVNRLIAPEILMEETTRFAQKLATKPPLSLRLIKEAVYKAVDYSLYEGMQFERKNFYLLFSSYDQKEGMKAFIEKRKPKFEGR